MSVGSGAPGGISGEGPEAREPRFRLQGLRSSAGLGTWVSARRGVLQDPVEKALLKVIDFGPGLRPSADRPQSPRTVNYVLLVTKVESPRLIKAVQPGAGQSWGTLAPVQDGLQSIVDLIVDVDPRSLWVVPGVGIIGQDVMRPRVGSRVRAVEHLEVLTSRVGTVNYCAPEAPTLSNAFSL